MSLPKTFEMFPASNSPAEILPRIVGDKYILELTHGQFEEVKYAMELLQKRREQARVCMAKKRLTENPQKTRKERVVISPIVQPTVNFGQHAQVLPQIQLVMLPVNNINS